MNPTYVINDSRIETIQYSPSPSTILGYLAYVDSQVWDGEGEYWSYSSQNWRESANWWKRYAPYFHTLRSSDVIRRGVQKIDMAKNT